MTVQSGQSVTVLFSTRVFATGVGTNADSLPAGTLYVNGTADAASVTVTNISTGLYKAAVTLPTLAIGDRVEISIAATVSSVSDKEVIWRDVKDIIADASGQVTAGAIAANAISAASIAADAGAEIADAVWDEAVSGHQTVGTAGRNLTLSGVILAETTADGTPTTTTLQLLAGSATDDFYNDLEIIPVSGTLAGQARIITDYAGATKTITIDEAWTSAPANGDAILIRARHTHTKNQIRDVILSDSTAFAGASIAAIKAKTDNLPADPADASVVSGRFDTIDTNLATVAGYIDTEVAATLAAVDTEVAAIKAKTDNLPAAPAATGDIPTANANADALLDRANAIETGWTIRQAIRIILSVIGGKVSGAATTTNTFRNVTDGKDRVTSTVDADGNRTAVTYDAT